MGNNLEKIVFGGGCFWCIEAIFQRVEGVRNVISGYSGGQMENPDYESVCRGRTGHAEVVKISYASSEVKLEKLLETFFVAHDPTTLNRQGNDAGTQYRSVIYYSNKEQKAVCEKYIREIQGEFHRPIVTVLKPLEKFYEAEEYHQKYFERNPGQPYCSFVIAPKLKKVMEKFGL